jgi:plastocyanin
MALRVPRRRNPTARVVATFLAVFLLVGLVGAAATVAKTHKNRVTIKGTYRTDYRFSPKTLTIGKGQTVTWSWHSDMPHNVTFNKKVHSDSNSRVTYNLTFKHRGTFTYKCTVHQYFKGQIVVK